MCLGRGRRGDYLHAKRRLLVLYGEQALCVTALRVLVQPAYQWLLAEAPVR